MARIFEPLNSLKCSIFSRDGALTNFVRKIALAGFLLISIPAFSQENTTYKKPPQSIIDLVEAPTTPTVLFSSNGEWMLVLENPGLSTIKTISTPELCIGGLRIQPETNGLSRSIFYTGIQLRSVKKGALVKKEAETTVAHLTKKKSSIAIDSLKVDPIKNVDSTSIIAKTNPGSKGVYSLNVNSTGEYSLVVDTTETNLTGLKSAHVDSAKRTPIEIKSANLDSAKTTSIVIDSLEEDMTPMDSLNTDSTESSSISSSFTGLPGNLHIRNISWSPNERKIAFSNTTPNGIELWIADLKTLVAERLSNLYLNDTFSNTLCWAPNGKTILAKFIVDDRPERPKPDSIPTGPIIQENVGKSTPSQTYQSPYDEASLNYFLTAQLKIVDLEGKTSNIKASGIIRSFEYSPDGNFILLEIIKKPYSYLVPVNQFAYTVEILNPASTFIKKICDVPLADNIPTGLDAVITGPREFGWRADKPATLFWVEAQDKGNPNVQARLRDIIYIQNAPFTQNKIILAECYLRFNNITWGTDNLAIVTERWWKTRAERRVYIQPGDATFRVNLVDRYYEDTYSDPGSFVTRKNEYKRNVLLEDDSSIFYISEGASPEGNHPLLSKFNIKTKLVDTLFHSKAPYYERPVFFNNKKFLITSRESVDSVPNYFRVRLSNLNHKQITDFTDPYPQLNGVQKFLISYKRLDGINLGGTLYLPKDYSKEDGRLPVLIWVCPSGYKTATAASEVKSSHYQFMKLNWASPIYWVNRGYAILDNADMPIVGESIKEPNNTFIEQLRYNAEAAVNNLVELGIADPKRIAIGGHAYGALMTADLLAHTNLFAAGIARSGVYNTTLTPFGFQSEERTYWQIPDIYNKISPFAYADKIKSPLLLIHGQSETDSGQTEQFYSSLKGHGATTRLVSLPAETSTYLAKESILHMMWEMDQWLEKYVKNKL